MNNEMVRRRIGDVDFYRSCVRQAAYEALSCQRRARIEWDRAYGARDDNDTYRYRRYLENARRYTERADECVEEIKVYLKFIVGA